MFGARASGLSRRQRRRAGHDVQRVPYLALPVGEPVPLAGFAVFVAGADAAAEADGGGGRVGMAEEAAAVWVPFRAPHVLRPTEQEPMTRANPMNTPHAFQFVGGGGFTVGSHW